MATDPVCGMFVDEASDPLRLVRDNRTYYFCCHACLDTFSAPQTASRRLARRLAVAWPLAVVAAILTYLPGPAVALWSAAAAATVVQFYAGYDFYVGSLDAVRARSGNMDLLIATGTSAAYGYSLVALVAPSLLSPSYFFDASSLVIALILSGNFLEQRTRAHAGSATRDLERLLPRESVRIDATGAHRVPRHALRIGDRVRILPGETVAVDGLVRDGRTEVDESMLTGESSRVAKARGGRVIAGSLNGTGAIEVEVVSIGPDTFVAQIAQMLGDAESARVPLRRLADRIAKFFVPFVLALAAGAALAWGIGGGASASTSVLVFVSVVIIACPCAFGIATPAALLVGTSRAAREGILFRGGDSIERAARTRVVIADKTGTLTTSVPELESVVAQLDSREPEALALAAGLEAHSEHVLARAVRRAAERRSIAPSFITDARAIPGAGIVGSRAGHLVEILSGPATAARGMDLGRLRAAVDATEERGASWSVLLEDGHAVALLIFSAPLAPGVVEGIRELGAMGIPVEMLTGDRSGVARTIAARVGIASVRAEATPAQKVDYVRERRRAIAGVAYVGDGINDAAALASADVGLAIGTGSDVARDAGQVLLVRPDFRAVPRAVALARAIVRKVRGNLVWAIGYNAVLLPIAAGALVPWLGFSVYTILPIAGAAAMAVSSTTVLLNSLSLRRVRLGGGAPDASAVGLPATIEAGG
ncbi:MAG: heavy metal translocating P-type ATPase [Thermoplasmata archaeon]